ncbi:hypothetical protein [Pseudoponticoccus marisrubri]|uniref:Uncharacterized protein n=1 Tax=Pseudoponticoccus marisrubri TaxID=1685382 RepID=A0A0W7WNM2_9RHOB|nr:hypothetical protein [Pseudoponticoccus marisrubri]KUF12185.1 hypothetical protein AVJ23_00145 [Pseudoponticoccus marisrubri]
MISVDDVVGMTCLSEEEVAAVAEHDHLSDYDAALLGDYLMHQHHGPARVQQMICEDIREALHADDVRHAKELYKVLHHFLGQHPEAVRGASPS